MSLKIKKYFIYSIISVFFVMFFSSISFIFKNYILGLDSAIFFTMGNFWKKGMIPYTDFFDNKGPFIFWINYVGQLFSNSRVGINIIQIIFMFFSIVGIEKTISLMLNKRKGKGIYITLFLSLLILYYDGGNLTEDYCLPFLIWSIYFAIRFITAKQYKNHKKYYGIIYGITFALGIMTRITNALPLCAFLVGVAIIIAKKEGLKELFINAVVFGLGNAIILLPFSVYLLYHNSFYKMIYASFIYNIKYAGNGFEGLSTFDWINKIIITIPLVYILIINLIDYFKEKNVLNNILLVNSIIALVFQIKQYLYPHYYMIWIPIIMVSLLKNKTIIGLFKLKKEELKNNKVIEYTIGIGLVLVLTVILAKDIRNIYRISTVERTKRSTYSREVKTITSEIPNTSKDKIIAYNVESWFYVESGIKPCYRFCILQDWACEKDPILFNEFKNNIKSKKADYIIENVEEGKLDSMINKDYYEVKRTREYRLLKKKGI